MTRPDRTVAAAITIALASAAAIAPSVVSAAEAMRVVRDPATGELRAPTAAEAAALDKAEARSRAASGKPRAAQAPVEIHHPDGSVETKLGDDSMMYSVVRSEADGRLTMACLPAREAEAFVKGSKKSSPAHRSAGRATHAQP